MMRYSITKDTHGERLQGALEASEPIVFPSRACVLMYRALLASARSGRPACCRGRGPVQAPFPPRPSGTPASCSSAGGAILRTPGTDRTALQIQFKYGRWVRAIVERDTLAGFPRRCSTAPRRSTRAAVAGRCRLRFPALAGVGPAPHL